MRFCLAVMRGLAASAMLVATGGCMAPAGYRLPQLLPRSPAYERAESLVHDPYPITDAGPDVSARPPAYNVPRPEPARVKQKAGISMMRNQYGTPVPPTFPGTNTPVYPNAVR